MDVNKNSYTIGFASIMVIIVAALLSFTALELKPYQSKNIEQEKKQNILKSVGILVERAAASDIYPEFIKEDIVLNYLGEIKNNMLASNVDLSKELKKDLEEQSLPLFIAEDSLGQTKYIIPLRGTGLWGPVWGFISLNDDLNTIYAAVFDHKAETPGLGAEINRPFFQDPFKGKKIMNDGEFVSVVVLKKPNNEISQDHQVDGISGGTITSDGVSEMINERLSKYLPYFKSISPEMQVQEVLSLINKDELTDTISNINKRIID